VSWFSLRQMPLDRSSIRRPSDQGHRVLRCCADDGGD
jgi:hypothetical protein